MELRKKLVIIVFSLALLACSAYAQKCFWWTVSSCGDVWLDDSLNNNGFTVGQVSAGPVASFYDSVLANYGFWNDFLADIELCFDLTTAFEDTMIWWSAGTLSLAETRTMSLADSIVITNCGNCHVNFGLAVDSVFPGEWNPHFWADRDRFVLRAKFTNDPVVPMSFSTANCNLKSLLFRGISTFRSLLRRDSQEEMFDEFLSSLLWQPELRLFDLLLNQNCAQVGIIFENNLVKRDK